MNLEREVALSSDGGRVVATIKALRLHDVAFDEDVCMEILLYLPIKSVIKFQTVCKQWLSLISSNHFRRLHNLRHHQSPPCVILTTPEPRLCHFNLIRKPTMMISFSINIPRCSEIFYHRIFSSCNGLVILHSFYDDYFHVCNPITRQTRKISLSPSDSYHHVKMLHLVFDPSKSLHYKIVCIRVEEHTYKIEVFDSEKGSWKSCMEPITISSILGITNSSAYCNNKIYVKEYYTHDGSLYCIDIDKNVVRLMTSPTVGMPERIAYAECVQETNGCVYYSALLYSVVSGQWACVWEKSKLEDDKWLLKHKDLLSYPEVWCVSTQLRFIPQTSTMLILAPPRKFMTYNFLEKSCNELLSFQERDNDESIHVFHQTLAPV